MKVFAENKFELRPYPRIQHSVTLPSLRFRQQKHKKCSLKWRSLTYTIQEGNSTKEILNEVSGYANSGEMLGILGSSGSGKTTLSMLLSKQHMYKSNINVHGSIELNGKRIERIPNYSKYVSFVMQHDVLLQTLTPREALTFSAQLKLTFNQKEIKENANKDEFIKKKVDLVLQTFGLNKVADQVIGGNFMKMLAGLGFGALSGGQKRRLSIGLELLPEPNVLILDEPTSGLDSYNAKIIIDILYSQAKYNDRTIIVTIHQPSKEMLNKFDKMMLMSCGACLYHGRVADSAEFFRNAGYICPDDINPADFYIEIVHVYDRNSISIDESAVFNDLQERYERDLEIINQEYKCEPMENIEDNDRVAWSRPFIELKVLIKRAWLNIIRNPLIFLLKTGHAVIVALMIDLLYNKIGIDENGVENRRGAISISIITFVLSPAQSNSLAFPSEKYLTLKESQEGLYSIHSYLISKICTEFPIIFLTTFLYSLVMYFATDLNLQSANQFFVFFIVLLLTHLVGAGYGNIAGAVSKDVMAAVVWGSTISAPLLMYSGIFHNGPYMSSTKFWFIEYVSAYYYAFQALILNEFTDEHLGTDVFVDPIQRMGVDGTLANRIMCLFALFIGTNVVTWIILLIKREDGLSVKRSSVRQKRMHQTNELL